MGKDKELKREEWTEYSRLSSHSFGEPYLKFVWRVKEKSNIEDISNKVGSVYKIEWDKLKLDEKKFEEITKNNKPEIIFCVIPVTLEKLEKLSHSLEPPIPIRKNITESRTENNTNWLGKQIITETTTYQIQIGNTIFESSESKEKTVPKDYKLLQDVDKKLSNI